MSTTMIPPRFAPCAYALLTAIAVGVSNAAFAANDASIAKAASPASAASANELQRIANERAAAETRYASRERECRTRFIVTSCVDDAKRERREALDQLRARQLGADEVRRRERAMERRSELAEKAAEDARIESERASRGAVVGASGAASQATRLRITSPRHEAAPGRTAGAASGTVSRSRAPDKAFGLTPGPHESAPVRREREDQNRAAFETRQRQAAEHREESATATLRRMASKSPAAALPAPSGASATKSR